MTELNHMMSRERLPTETRIRLREYFHQTHHIRQAKKRSELLELMSPTLRSEVAWLVNKEWLSRVWFVKGASLPFLVQVRLGEACCHGAPWGGDAQPRPLPPSHALARPRPPHTLPGLS